MGVETTRHFFCCFDITFGMGVETTRHFTGAYENQTEEYIKISYTKSRPSDSEFTSLQGKPAFKAVKVGLNVANDGKGPVPIFYESLDGNADSFEATIKNMANLKEHLKVDRIIRINDKGCFSAKIVAETVSCWFDRTFGMGVKPTKRVKQGFDLIGSMKLQEQYIKLLEDAFLQGQDFILLDYLSQNQARKKEPAEQDRYYGLEVKSSLTYGQKEYPMRFIFVRSVRKAHQRQRLMDGKIKRDRNRREKQRAKIVLLLLTPIPKVLVKSNKKIENEIQNLQEKVGMPYYRDPKKLQAKIDKLCKRHPEGKHLKIELLIENGKAISLDYKWDKEAVEKEAIFDGIYLLGTTLMEHPMGTVFGLFKEQP